MRLIPVFAAAALLAGCDKPPAPQAAAPPRPVRVQPAVLTAPTETLAYSGTIQARREASLSFRVGGKVLARPVDLGAPVRAGDVLAVLDPADLRLQAEAAANAVTAAAADAANARAEARRYESLGSASAAFIKSESDRRNTAAAVAAAKLAQAQRQYDLAQSQLGYGVLRAPADGTVTAVPVEAGQVVQAGQTVVMVAQSGETEVLVDVPENRVAAVRAATSIAVTPWATESERPGRATDERGPGRATDEGRPGRIREVAGRADPVSRTFAVRVAVTGEDLPLGGTATVRFTGAGAGPVAVLPAGALSDRGGKPAVWVLDPARQRATPRPVEVAGYDANSVAIAAGLKGGELVVTAGVTGLDPELPVVAWAGAQR